MSTTTPLPSAATPASSGGSAATVHRLRLRGARRVALCIVALAALLSGLMLARVLLGTFTVTPADFVRILSGETIPGASYIVLQEKLPRAVAAALAGAALGASGALYRRTLRNPLASPDILGVTVGAAAGVVTFMALSAGQLGGTSTSLRALAALVGALLASLAVFAAARSIGGARFIVAGIGVAAGAQAIIAGLMLSLSPHDLQAATVWIAGSLTGVTWERIGLLAAALVVLLPVGGLLHTRLAALDLGTDLAHSLGARPRRLGAAALGVGALLAAAATAAVGPLAFVALLSTPLALGLTRGRPSLAVAALTSAVLVVTADLVAAEAVGLLFDGTRLPTGVLTGAAGAPLMLWLLLTTGRNPS
ncbi:MAG: iron chelate uptake ABC transporter family permease subunit [Micrococcus sp.]|nr:iron chelate uptake ABC transporter family permease subunit [Micrococcus sp.]